MLRKITCYTTMLTLLVLLGSVFVSTHRTFAQDQEENLSTKIYLPLVMGSAEEVELVDADNLDLETETTEAATEEMQAAAVNAQTVTLHPTDDTYTNKFDPAGNRGGSSIIHVNGDATRTKYGYLKFNVNNLLAGTYISKATLRLYAQTTARLALGAFHVADDSWSETTLTWNNKPATDSTRLSAVSATTANAYAQFDVTAAVSGVGLHSFSIMRLSTTNLDVTFATKESAVGKPELIITYAPCVKGQVNAKLVPTCGALLGAWSARTNVNWKTAIEQHENVIGRHLDVIRNFHPPAQHYQALTAEEKALIQAGRTLLIGYRPAALWADAGGGNAVINQEITNLAISIKSVAPRKVMIILFHEPERYVTGSGGNPGNAGTPPEYVQMWRNVRTRFNNAGVSNVVWVWNVQNLPQFQHLLPLLWPGNDLVDWVMWNPYVGSENERLVDVVAAGYQRMTVFTTANNINKPWGFGEWGIGVNNYIPSPEKQANELRLFRDTLSGPANPFPKLKLLAIFDARQSAIQPGAEAAYREFATSPYLQQLQ